MSTPKEELQRLFDDRLAKAERRRVRLQTAVLVASGELGYAKLSVQDVLERAGVGRTRFYREFSNLGDCYSSAYAAEIDRLLSRLLSGCGGGWRAGLERALADLGELVVERPLLTKGLLVEVHVAGGRALAKRREVWERLSHALDGARRETAEPRHSPPPLTASFMLSAIEAAVGDYLLGDRSDNFRETLSELRALILETYLGPQR